MANKANSLSHTKWLCKYHLVFTTEYRRKIIYNQLDNDHYCNSLQFRLNEKITANQLYKILLKFDKLYYKMTDLEKMELLRDFIYEVELYSEKQENGRIIKHIAFTLPVFYEGAE